MSVLRSVQSVVIGAAMFCYVDRVVENIESRKCKHNDKTSMQYIEFSEAV